MSNPIQKKFDNLVKSLRHKRKSILKNHILKAL